MASPGSGESNRRGVTASYDVVTTTLAKIRNIRASRSARRTKNVRSGSEGNRKAGVLVLVTLMAFGCFEDPVQEKVEIELRSDGRMTITSTVELLSISREENAAAWRRVEYYRKLLLEGSDPWTHRFEVLEPRSETYGWEKFDGELARLTRSALVTEDQLSLFFGDMPLSVFVTGDGDWRELAIYPGTSDRASTDQRLRLERRLAPWTRSLSSYLRALDAFYDYLEGSEHRGRDLLIHVFEEFVPDEDRETALLSEDEEVLVNDLRERMSEAWKILEVGGDEAYSLNEISHLVFDPFPSDLEIVLPGEPLEVEGFERDGNRLVVRRTGLWEAFDELSGRWATPDLLTLWIDAAVNGVSIDPDEILARRFVASAASAEEIRSTLEEKLRPLPQYRVRWRVSDE